MGIFYHIYLKNLTKIDTNWITKKTVLGWDIDMVKKLLPLIQSRRDRISSIPESIPQRASILSKHKWFCLLGILRSAAPEISGVVGMFIQIHNELNTSGGI